MGLKFDPIGGGQFKQAIKTIIEAESQPLRQLESRKAREDAKMKLFQEFKGKFGAITKSLEEVASFQKFRELKADLGDGANLAGVTIDKTKAQPGSFQIEIEELAARTSAMSNGFENPDEPILGMGFIVIEDGNGENFEIFVDDNKASLRGIADMINAQKTAPVRAAVIKDSSEEDEPWKLILTAKKEGIEQGVTFPDFYFLDGVQDFYLDQDNESQNALIKVDGFPIELAGNSVEDFLPGVNLQLKAAKPGHPFTLTITEDFQKISGKMKGIVDSMNGVLEFINKQNAIDEGTDTRTTFAGDTSLQSVEYRFRNLLHEGFPIYNQATDELRVVHLSQMGVEFDKGGKLSFKEEKFQKFMESDFEGTAEAITGEMGFAYQLKNVLDGYGQSKTGLLGMREQGLRARVKDLDRQIETKTRLIERRQTSLTEQFARLQGSLANLQRQQQYLQASLPGAGGGGNLVQQLLGG